MKFLYQLADQRIREAMSRGEFDNLKGQGKPLQLDDDSMIPEDQRLAYRVLKNAGYAPEAVSLRGEIERLEAQAQSIPDNEAQLAAYKRLALLKLRLDAQAGRSRSLAMEYDAVLIAKLSRPEDE